MEEELEWGFTEGQACVLPRVQIAPYPVLWLLRELSGEEVFCLSH